MTQTWLISYQFVDDVEAMEKQIKEQNGFSGVVTLAVSRLADEE